SPHRGRFPRARREQGGERDGARRASRVGSQAGQAEEQATESRARPEPAHAAMLPSPARAARFASTPGTPPERARRRRLSPSALWPRTVLSARPDAAYLAERVMDVLLPERLVRPGHAAWRCAWRWWSRDR